MDFVNCWSAETQACYYCFLFFLLTMWMCSVLTWLVLYMCLPRHYLTFAKAKNALLCIIKHSLWSKERTYMVTMFVNLSVCLSVTWYRWLNYCVRSFWILYVSFYKCCQGGMCVVKIGSMVVRVYLTHVQGFVPALATFNDQLTN